jgi:hypothetical protein
MGNNEPYNSNNTVYVPPPNNTQPNCPAPPSCPACQRCPESSFECKKVPNYSTIDGSELPVPMLGNFSTFGM